MADEDPAETDAADKVVPLRGQRCPACGKATVYAYRPFCSKRCADLDLGKWLSEDYRVATDEQPDQDDEV